jgi:hypothetical protein
MVLLYWDIGRTILDRQQAEGWGAKVIDRLSTDLREAFPVAEHSGDADQQPASPANRGGGDHQFHRRPPGSAQKNTES